MFEKCVYVLLGTALVLFGGLISGTIGLVAQDVDTTYFGRIVCKDIVVGVVTVIVTLLSLTIAFAIICYDFKGKAMLRALSLAIINYRDVYLCSEQCVCPKRICYRL